MNPKGNPATLVAAHPGNTNAVKYGVHSDRWLAERTAEIITQLTEACQFSPTELVAVHEVARYRALLEAIDRDLDDRGVVDKRGEPRYLLSYRVRYSRQLDHWLSKITGAIERQSADGSLENVGRPDFIRELKRIALGQDSTASAHDRVRALTALLSTEPVPERPYPSTLVIKYEESDFPGLEIDEILDLKNIEFVPEEDDPEEDDAVTSG